MGQRLKKELSHLPLAISGSLFLRILPEEEATGLKLVPARQLDSIQRRSGRAGKLQDQRTATDRVGRRLGAIVNVAFEVINLSKVTSLDGSSTCVSRVSDCRPVLDLS